MILLKIGICLAFHIWSELDIFKKDLKNEHGHKKNFFMALNTKLVSITAAASKLNRLDLKYLCDVEGATKSK